MDVLYTGIGVVFFAVSWGVARLFDHLQGGS
jgi:hypothetical protein